MSDNDSQLEAEFLALASTIGEQIKAKVELAEKALAEAIELADKHGIPFHAGISELGQSYVPPTFRGRFESLDRETVAELLDIPEYDLDYARGWRHSQIGC